MKTREELEKMFDEEFWELYHLIDVEEYWWKEALMWDEVKQFIFKTIIPEILKSIREEYWSFDNWCWCCSTTILGTEIRQKAKELYWIDL